MSKTRIVENVYIDRDRLIRAGVNLGLEINYGITPSPYVSKVCEVVVGRIGWDDGKIYYDDMDSHRYKELMTEYYTNILTEKGYRVMAERIENKVVMTVRR